MLLEYSFVLVDGLLHQFNVAKLNVHAIRVSLMKAMLKQTVGCLNIHRNLRRFHSFGYSIFKFVGLPNLLVALKDADLFSVGNRGLLAFAQLVNPWTFLCLNDIFVVSALHLARHILRTQMEFFYLGLEVFPLQPRFVVTCRRNPLDLLLFNFF